MINTLHVTAPAGTFVGTLTDNGRLFAGIPFALAPTGHLRFRPPQPRNDATEPIDATRFPPAPAQGGTALRMSAGTETATKPQPSTIIGDGQAGAAMSALMAAAAGRGSLETSEDCLYLNVWTPDAEGALPVVVWLYGGGFDVGSASPPFTDAAAFARLANVVVVAINYRVGALGFGYWAGVGGDEWAESSNLGLQDQAAGLRWVRRNIASFGGDPDNVTLAGESAGAFSIGTLLTLPLAHGLFDKAILQSGNTRRVFPTESAEEVAQTLLNSLGVTTMAELQSVDLDAILHAQGAVVDGEIGARNLPGGRSWGVVRDGVIVTRDPHEALRAGEARMTPILVGANRDEVLIFRRMLGDAFAAGGESALEAEMRRAHVPDPSGLLAAYRSRLGVSPDVADIRAAFLSDAIYRRPATETAAAQIAAGGQAWTYLFSATPAGPALGAFHGAEMSYLFDQLGAVGLDTPENLAVRDTMVKAWHDFAYLGNPGWPTYDHAVTRQFGAGPDLVAEPPRDAVTDVWPFGHTED